MLDEPVRLHSLASAFTVCIYNEWVKTKANTKHYIFSNTSQLSMDMQTVHMQISTIILWIFQILFSLVFKCTYDVTYGNHYVLSLRGSM